MDETGSDHDKLAKEAENEADNLEHHGDKLEEDIETTRDAWERKKEDSSVPGAVPDPGDESDTAQSESAQDNTG